MQKAISFFEVLRIREKNLFMDIKDINSLIAPKEIIEKFDLVEIKETGKNYELIFEEKQELIPELMLGSEVVLDGFCNPLSLLSFPLKGKPTYLVIKRRRWKPKGGGNHVSNEYYFNHPSVKATKEFAAFLKEVFGHTPDEYIRLSGTDGD
jgi:hypothetical protein